MMFTDSAPLHQTTEQRRASKAKGMHDARKRAFLNRPIVAWDGEGVTDEDGEHRYILLAYVCSDGTSGFLRSAPGESLSFYQCADFLIKTAAHHSEALNIIFSGDYDLMMILKGYHPQMRGGKTYSLARLRTEKGYTRFGEYLVSWTPHKGFTITRRTGKSANGKSLSTIKVWDVWSYFQSSFINAAKDYLGSEYGGEIADIIERGKANRSTFSEYDSEEITLYCLSELHILIRIFAKLRASLAEADLLVTAFDGPGAVAAALLRQKRIKPFMAETPEHVREASRYAYAGGRFEVFKFGHVERPVYEYDINSAYPEAIATLPVLAGGWWETVNSDPGSQPFALYQVSFIEREWRTRRPMPIPLRSRVGNIIFSTNVVSWIWSPEMEALRHYCARYPSAQFKVLRSYVFHPSSACSPFAFVPEYYALRQRYKAEGNEAQRALKLALNSLYGKMAQRVGYDTDDKPPPYHQLEWAGYVTSYTRAKLFFATYLAEAKPEDSIIAYATDAVFSTVPFDHLRISKELGDWERTVFDNFTLVTSGVYAGNVEGAGERINKSRGIPSGQLTRERMIDCIAKGESIPVSRDTFFGIGLCLQYRNFRYFANWYNVTKEVAYPWRDSKRVHLYDGSCCPDKGSDISRALAVGRWHNTFVDPAAMITPKESYPHDLPWIKEDETEDELWTP